MPQNSSCAYVRTYVHGFLIKLPSRKVTWINCAVQARLNYMSELKIHWPFRWAVTHACGYLNDHFLLALMHADLILFYGVGILSSFIRVSLRLVFSRLVCCCCARNRRTSCRRRLWSSLTLNSVQECVGFCIELDLDRIVTDLLPTYPFKFWRNNSLCWVFKLCMILGAIGRNYKRGAGFVARTKRNFSRSCSFP